MNRHRWQPRTKSSKRWRVSLGLVLLGSGWLPSVAADSARRGKPRPVARAPQSDQQTGGYRQHGAYRPKGRAHQPKVTADQGHQRFGNYYQYSAAGAFGSASNVPPGFYENLNPAQRPGVHYPPFYIPPVVDIPFSPNPTIVIENNLPPPQVVYIERPVPVPAPAPVVAPPAPAVVPPTVAPPAVPTPPRSREPGELTFQVRPSTAEVFLDEDFLGTGAEVSQRDPVALRAAVYVLEVKHPDHESERLFFGIDAHSTQRIEVDLTAERAAQRVRVRELK